MLIKDKLARGLVAGIAAGVVMSMADLILTGFGWVKFPYYDWGLSLISGSVAETFPEIAIGLVIHLMFAGVLGVIFSYAIQLIPSTNSLLRGWLYGVVVWFAVHVIVNLFGFQPLKPIPMSQLLSDFLTASVFGLVLAATNNRLSPKIR
ncbi:DUF1440 domain-containing protein [Dethiobacter alkaliphilus]|uniref:DUF1440 domain-containing protein n=1 Tax=Dethiobacter alkaliphilus TaxID=427926 RepID=UPI002225C0C3|nr:DUF1440 domain-containing protein [Dethiobacter alkaliphilus]MCW3488519.1 DUF1440 domain-containing protein [Dethiobacter alkaliphilus]